MLEIMTIRDFMNLPAPQRDEVLKAVRVKDRLDMWLDSLNGKKPAMIQSEWKKCRYCNEGTHQQTADGTCWVLHEPRNDSDIHPSQINKCLKKLWFDCAGFATEMEENIKPHLRRTFDLGHAWHHTVQSYGRQGAWCERQYYRDEVPIEADAVLPNGEPALPTAARLWIRGSADAVIDRYILPNVPTLGEVCVRMVHEYKTINSNGFTNLKRPKPDHKWQATIYSGVFDVPLVVFLYLNKDSSQQVDYPIPFDQVLWQQIEEKIQAVQHYINADQMPPWDITSAVLNPAECTECGYNRICQPKKR